MKRFLIGLLFICVAAVASGAESGYTAHEWGTFTSVQGGDGKLLLWAPQESSPLPSFVHRQNLDFTLKGMMLVLQRMETPVIYFHSDRPFQVDVDVRFPEGKMTEWYPQAGIVEKSQLAWTNLSVTPYSLAASNLLPQDAAGSHYFTAREAASDMLREDLQNKSETEKLLFYRGAGNFETPLRATIDAQDHVTIENAGEHKLSHLFLVSIHNGQGSFTELDSLRPHASKPDSFSAMLPLADMQKALATQMAKDLAGEGLFKDEAKAMVDTWKDSWFTDEGERVLYILPREWTDSILPLSFSPKPKHLVRVMVGRAEIIMPQKVAHLSQLMQKGEAGDANARAQTEAELKKLGRFAFPAMELVRRHDKPVSTPGQT